MIPLFENAVTHSKSIQKS